uniref:Prolyl-tRNA synthetase n=1 Tax=Plectus sambesii TaxID=2011161 RepID=A0A914XAQ2_9BILA
MSRLRFASRLFSPPSDLQGSAQHNAKCKSLKLMLNNGLIHHASGSGLFHLLPLGQRAMDKLLRIISEEMDGIGAQKLTCAALGPRKLWETTQRWDKMGSEMFTLTDRNEAQFCLQPTYEEAVTEIVANAGQQPVGRFPV